MTSDIDWSPIIYGNSISNSTTWYDDVANETTPFADPNFDQIGNHKHRTVANHPIQDLLHYFDTVLFEPPDEDDNILLCIKNAIITILYDDYEIVPNFFWKQRQYPDHFL